MSNKVLPITNYSFVASTGVITFTGYTAISLQNVMYVANVKNGIEVAMYDSSTAGLGATVSTNVLTLAFNTTAMANGDPLLIMYNDDEATNNTLIKVPVKPQIAGGIAIDITSLPLFTAGYMAALAINKDNGGLLVNQGIIDASQDSISTFAGSSSLDIGGLQSFRNSAVSTTGVNVKLIAGNLYRYNIINPNASSIFVKFYNNLAASSSNTPFLTIQVPANSTVNQEFIVNEYFSACLSIRCCTGVADSDNTAAGTLPIIELRYGR